MLLKLKSFVGTGFNSGSQPDQFKLFSRALLFALLIYTQHVKASPYDVLYRIGCAIENIDVYTLFECIISIEPYMYRIVFQQGNRK